MKKYTITVRFPSGGYIEHAMYAYNFYEVESFARHLCEIYHGAYTEIGYE